MKLKSYTFNGTEAILLKTAINTSCVVLPISKKIICYTSHVVYGENETGFMCTVYSLNNTSLNTVATYGSGHTSSSESIYYVNGKKVSSSEYEKVSATYPFFTTNSPLEIGTKNPITSANLERQTFSPLYYSYSTWQSAYFAYVANNAPLELERDDLQDGWHVTSAGYVESRGVRWYYLNDTDGGDYYGWVDEKYIDWYD